MQIFGFVVTICLVLGISVVVAIIMFYPYSTVNQSSWEPVFRSYDENIKAVSRSHLLTALLDRYEKYIRPLISSKQEGGQPLPTERSPKFLATSNLLKSMVDPYSSYVKMFHVGDEVLVLTVKAVNVLSEGYPAFATSSDASTKAERTATGEENFPIIGKVVLFSLPTITLLNKNESANFTNDEAMGLNICWESYVPGIPISTAFSSDYKSFVIDYRIIVPGGFKYRARYFSTTKCNHPMTELPVPGYYNKYAELDESGLTEYTPNYDDIHLHAYSYISSIAVSDNKLAYSVLYDTHTFHLMEKVNGTWTERTDVPRVYRDQNLYEFCHDLFMTDRDDGSTQLISFTRKGNSLNSLYQDLCIYELNPNKNAGLTLLHQYRIDTRLLLAFSLADLESPPSSGSMFSMSKNKDVAFIAKSYDKIVLMELPNNTRQIHVPEIVSRKLGVQAIAELTDLSIVAVCQKEAMDITFFTTENGECTGTKGMSLSQLPKSLQKKKIIDMILLDSNEIAENDTDHKIEQYLIYLFQF